MNIHRIVGPPGTGKTTKILELIASACLTYTPEEVGAVSFTNAAVNEMRDRIVQTTEVDPSIVRHVKTMHAHCFQLLSLDKEQVADKNIKEWNQAFPQYALKLPYFDSDFITTDLIETNEEIWRIIQICRNRLIPESKWPSYVLDFWKCWQSWLMETGYIDFTGMLEQVRIIGRCPPVKMLYVDECFPGDIKITLPKGKQRSIQEIVENKIGGKVLSYNESTKKIEEKNIIGWHKVPLNNRKILQIDALRATEDHPIYTKGYGYLPLQKCINLRTVDMLYLDYEKIRSENRINKKRKIDYSRFLAWRCREEMPSSSQSPQKTNQPFVYCIDVEDNHNFFANNYLVHNCQDLSRLQMEVILMWAKNVDTCVLVGDADQCIYRFAGADPKVFAEIPHSWGEVLAQSYRVPPVVHAEAMRILSQIRDRELIEYKACLKNETGQILHCTEPDFSLPGTHMLISRCGFRAEYWRKKLEADFRLWCNPYRPEDKILNIEKTEEFAALKTYYDLSQGTEVNEHDLKKMVEKIKAEGNFERGAKSRIEKKIVSKKKKCDIFDLSEWGFSPDFLTFRKGLDDLFSFKTNSGKYGKILAEMGKLDQEAITLGTIHSVKGGEADNVWIDSKKSWKILQAEAQDPNVMDDELRIMYVAVTRAKRTVGFLDGRI